MIYNESKFNTEWDTLPLSKLGEFKRGKSKHRPRNDKKLFEGGIYPLVQTGEIKAANLLIKSHSANYNDEGLKQSKMWPAGTLVITIAANIAETGILAYPMCFPDSCVGFIADKEKTSELFMHYVFTYIKRSIQNSAVGSIQDNINIEMLTALNFKIPKKPIQDLIVDLLATIDYKIELNNDINTELENLAKTIYNYWFVQFDFPNEEGKPYKTSGGEMVWNEELKREIPRGWKVRELKDLFDYKSDSVSANVVDIGIPYTPVDCLPKRRMSFGFSENYTKAKTSLIRYNKYDVLIGAMRVYFHRVCIAPYDGITRTTTIVLRPRIKNYLPYLYQVCNEERTIEYAANISVGTQQPYVNWENALECFQIPYPDDTSIIDNYCNLIMPLIEKVITHELQNQELIKLRDFLLPLLMNGQVKIKSEATEQLSMAAEPQVKYGK